MPELSVRQDSECEFLQELLTGFTKWKTSYQQTNNVREKEYAEAYRLLLSQFSQVDIQGKPVDEN